MHQHPGLTWLMVAFLVAHLGRLMVRADILIDKVGITDASTGITKSEILRMGGQVFSTSRATLSWIWRKGRHAFINYFAPCMYWAGKKVVGIAVSTGTALVVQTRDVLAAQRAGLVGIPVNECGDGIFCALGGDTGGGIVFVARSDTLPLLKELILQVVIYQSNETPPELYYIQQLEERGQIEAYRTDEYFARVHPFMAVTTSAGKKALIPFQLAGRWLALLTPAALDIMRDSGSRLGLASLRRIRRQIWQPSTTLKAPLPGSRTSDTAPSRPRKPQSRIPPKEGRGWSPSSKSATKTRRRSDEPKKSQSRPKGSSVIKTSSEATTLPRREAHSKHRLSKIGRSPPPTKTAASALKSDQPRQARQTSPAAPDKAKAANTHRRGKLAKKRSGKLNRSRATTRPGVPQISDRPRHVIDR